MIFRLFLIIHFSNDISPRQAAAVFKLFLQNPVLLIAFTGFIQSRSAALSTALCLASPACCLIILIFRDKPMTSRATVQVSDPPAVALPLPGGFSSGSDKIHRFLASVYPLLRAWFRTRPRDSVLRYSGFFRQRLRQAPKSMELYLPVFARQKLRILD